MVFSMEWEGTIFFCVFRLCFLSSLNGEGDEGMGMSPGCAVGGEPAAWVTMT